MITNRQYLQDKAIGGLQVPFPVFAEEWNNCWVNPQRDTSTLFIYLDPVIKHWIRMLRDPSVPKNVAYMSVLCRLETNDKITLMREWGAQQDIYQELALSYCRLLRGHCMNTGISGDILAQMYMFQRSHGQLLTHIIRSFKSQTKRWSRFEYTEYDVANEIDKPIDAVILDLEADPFDHYIITTYLADKLDKEHKEDFRRVIDAYKARLARQ